MVQPPDSDGSARRAQHGEMTAAQRSAAMALVSSALSRAGLRKGSADRRKADEMLKTKERNNPMFGKDLYYISILGTPSEKDPWMLQFGGHHLALNITIAGERGILTPTLTGAQPALYTVDGKTVRPLGQESDKAFALLNALDEDAAEAGDSEFPSSPTLCSDPGRTAKRSNPRASRLPP